MDDEPAPVTPVLTQFAIVQRVFDLYDPSGHPAKGEPLASFH